MLLFLGSLYILKLSSGFLSCSTLITKERNTVVNQISARMTSLLHAFSPFLTKSIQIKKKGTT